MSSHWYSTFRHSGGDNKQQGSTAGYGDGGTSSATPTTTTTNIAGMTTGVPLHQQQNKPQPAARRGGSAASRYLLRSSLRSKGSSSSSGERDPRERFKDCCRKIVQFLFSQVGVGALVVGYAIFGAFAFIAVEGGQERIGLRMIEHREAAAQQLWNVTEVYNVLNFEKWNTEVEGLIKSYQREIVAAVKKTGFDPRRPDEEIWSFPVSLMFSISVITMVGYGEFTPTTDWGKISTMVYAFFGIPIYILYLSNMGKILAETFKYLYARLYLCNHRHGNKHGNLASGNHKYRLQYEAGGKLQDPGLPIITVEDPDGMNQGSGAEKPVIVPTTACMWVMVLYITVATITFAEWEQWNYLDSAYFVATTLMKIGLGDFVPGTSRNSREAAGSSKEANQTKLVINFLFILIGMGLVAMCYYLMREEVMVKVGKLKEQVKDRCRPLDSSSSASGSSSHHAIPVPHQHHQHNIRGIQHTESYARAY